MHLGRQGVDPLPGRSSIYLLDDGTDLKVVTGVDDHSRFCVAAGLVRR